MTFEQMAEQYRRLAAQMLHSLQRTGVASLDDERRLDGLMQGLVAHPAASCAHLLSKVRFARELLQEQPESFPADAWLAAVEHDLTVLASATRR